MYEYNVLVYICYARYNQFDSILRVSLRYLVVEIAGEGAVSAPTGYYLAHTTIDALANESPVKNITKIPLEEQGLNMEPDG